MKQKLLTRNVPCFLMPSLITHQMNLLVLSEHPDFYLYRYEMAGELPRL